MSSAVDMSVESLKKSLAANGLAQYGTKEQMLHRLLTGGTEKKGAKGMLQSGTRMTNSLCWAGFTTSLSSVSRLSRSKCFQG